MDNKSLLPQYQQLVQQIRVEIFEGTYSSKLPSERELAQKFNVSYMTARKAVGVLVDQGLLVRSHGQGTFVREPGLSQEFRSVGILLPSGARGGAANPYYAQVIDGACRRAGEFHLGLAISDSLETLFDPDNTHLRRMADGLIVCPNSCTQPQLEMVSRFLPVVLIEWDNGNDPAIVVDNISAMSKVVAHLVELGHSRIAFIGGPENMGAQSAPALERKQGFFEGMIAAGLEITDEYLCYGDFEFSSGQMAASQLLSLAERPQAIVCANDLMALGALRCAVEAGISIPEQLSITGFDDISAAEYVTPSLTTVAPPKGEIGSRAVELLRELSLGKSETRRKVVLPAEFVARTSSGVTP